MWTFFNLFLKHEPYNTVRVKIKSNNIPILLFGISTSSIIQLLFSLSKTWMSIFIPWGQGSFTSCIHRHSRFYSSILPKTWHDRLVPQISISQRICGVGANSLETDIIYNAGSEKIYTRWSLRRWRIQCVTAQGMQHLNSALPDCTLIF